MVQSDDPQWIKAFFLGPKSENESWLRGEMQSILGHWFRWRQDLFPDDPAAISNEDRMSADFLQQREKLSQNLAHLNEMLRDEIPKYSPRYIGHMVSEISLPAILGHMAALVHNPNNTSKEAARVTLTIEKEAIEMLANMVGYDPDLVKGHFTSGGTVANFEAIWRARFRMDHWISLSLYLAEEKGIIFNLMHAAHMGWDKYFDLLLCYNVSEDDTRRYSLVGSNPFEAAALISKHIHQPYKGPVVLVPGNKHFSWSKGVNIFGLGDSSFWTIPLDNKGRLDVAQLQKLLDKAEMEMRPVMMTVSVTGTTEAGEIDPVDKVQDILDHYKAERGLSIWHHIDAAYAGTATILEENRHIINGVEKADSYVFNPHKWMFTNFDCSAYFVKDKKALIKTFEILPEYLKTNADSEVNNYRDWGIQLGRRFRSLKLWFVIRSMGVSGIKEKISNHIKWAKELSEMVKSNDHFVLHEPQNLACVCFRLKNKRKMELDKYNRSSKELIDRINKSGKLYISHTKVNDEFTFRFVIGNTYVTKKHILEAWEFIASETENYLNDV
ncbi:MAG: hypothetical protein KAS71_04020 [Bacteroidales bacterium]|nr:hypothetical protein [Bacteroidales bacterium]